MMMEFFKPATRRACLGMVAIMVALSGCASMQAKTPEEQVSKLAEQRWDALIKRDFDAAYGYAQPGFRAVVTRDAYKKRFGDALQWKAVQIHEATCEVERCTVRIRLTSINMVPNFSKQIPEVTGYFDETWIRDDGKWWFYEAF